MIKKVRKKPMIVEAIQFTGNNKFDICEFVKGQKFDIEFDDEFIKINTLEGTMIATKGNWIIKGIKGEVWPVREDIFNETYEIIEEGKNI